MDYRYCRYTDIWNGAGGDYLQGQMPTATGFFLILCLSNSCGLVVPPFTCTNVLLQGNTLRFQGRSITKPLHCGKSRQPQPCKISDFFLQGLIWSYQEGLVFLCCWRALPWEQELFLLHQGWLLRQGWGWILCTGLMSRCFLLLMTHEDPGGGGMGSTAV